MEGILELEQYDRQIKNYEEMFERQKERHRKEIATRLALWLPTWYICQWSSDQEGKMVEEEVVASNPFKDIVIDLDKLLSYDNEWKI